MISSYLLLTFLLAALLLAAVPARGTESHPYVLLAYDGTGDFGPDTPNTRTAGWQEALDYCAASARDLYVKGGYGGRQAIYHIDTTIRVPPAQDFRIDGGVYVINFRGPDPGVDALVIDSAMNCDYQFGIVVDQGATEVTGLEIAASHNVFDIATRPGGFAPAAQIVLQEPASGNRLDLRTDEDPLGLVTDRAITPTNQLSWTGSPASIRHIEGTSGTFVYTQRLYPATVAVADGQIERIFFERNGERIDYGPSANRDIHLSIGDRLIVESRDAPVLRVVPLKSQ